MSVTHPSNQPRPMARERGATLIVVAVSLLMLMGVLALAIDGGLGYDVRRGSQNAADNAALAAAWESCNPANTPADPAGEALATAKAQGFDDTDSNVTVTPSDLGGGMWQVEITVVNDGVFGPATPFAGDSITVVSDATASCVPTEFLGGKALFAGAQDCNPPIELNMTGSTMTVDGGIFSNGSLNLNFSHGNPVLSGPTEYGDPANSNTGTQYTGPIPAEYPIDFNIGDYRPGGSRASGSYFNEPGDINNKWMVDNGHADPAASGTGVNITESGIYYAGGSIKLTNVTTDPGVEVTFVAEGPIDVVGSADGLHGYSPVVPGGSVGLLMFSDYGSSPSSYHENPPNGTCLPVDAISFSNANLTDAQGLIFAPHSSVQISSSTVDLDGTIIAYIIKSSGSSFDIQYVNDPAFVPEHIVELVS